MKAQRQKSADTNADPLTAMQLFVLAMLVYGGANSVYDLKRLARLTQGGVRPILELLESRKFIQRSRSQGDLQKRDIHVTDAGMYALDHRWSWDLNRVLQQDMDSLLRLAWVALTVNRAAAVEFLRDAVAIRQKMASSLRSQLEDVPPESKDLSLTYRWMKGIAEMERVSSEADALRQILKGVEK
jgi:DNA-binding MarR family transcriptional regulator